MVSALVNILLFIFVVGVLTLVHEVGHFVAAKIVKAKVYEFSIGFGPKLISKKYKDTLYCIRAIPLGGYVKILGDGDPGEEKDKEKYSKGNLNKKPKILQIFVMVAGVSMNLFLAIALYYTVLGMSGWKTVPIYLDFEKINIKGPVVERVIGYETVPEGNADLAGMPEYGIIKAIDGKEIEGMDALEDSLKGKESVNVYICDEKEIECEEYFVELNEDSKMVIYTAYAYVLDYTDIKPFAGAVYLANDLKIIGHVFKSMIGIAKETGDYSDLSNTVSGPVGIFLLIDSLKTKGLAVFLSLIADLSLSLAIMNLLPIPALDGGRVLILLVEGVLRKDIDERIEAVIINGSMIFLILLIVLVIVKDIVNIDTMRNMFG